MRSGGVHAGFVVFAFLSVIAVSEARASWLPSPVDIGLSGANRSSALWIDRFIDATDDLWQLLECSPAQPPSKDPNIRMPELADCADQAQPPKVPDPAALRDVDDSTLRLIEVLSDPANPADPEKTAELKASLYAMLFRFGL